MLKNPAVVGTQHPHLQRFSASSIMFMATVCIFNVLLGHREERQQNDN